MGTMNPVARAESELARLEELMQAQSSPEPQPEPEPPAAPQEDPQPEPQPEPEPAPPPEEDWKRKYHGLQGTMKGLKEQLQQLQAQNQQLQAQLEQLATAKPQPATTAPEVSDDELIAEFGADHPLFRKLAFYEHKINGLEQQLEASRQQLGEKVDTVAKQQGQKDSEAFMARLSERVPGWEAVLDSPEFDYWASSTRDKFSGQTMQELFAIANKSWNMDSMVAIFEAYQGPKQRPVPTDNTPPKPDPRAAMVTPGGKPSAGADPGPKVWTESEVNQAFTNIRRGRYSREDAVRIEADITRANAEGRIVPG